MTEDWAADVKRFAPNADDSVIAAIVSYCGIALRNRDSSLVSFNDPAETGRVRENFLKKKLGLTQSDAALDGAIAAVGERMKGVNFKNRVTVYYLLLEHFGLTHLFARSGTAGATVAGAAPDLPLSGLAGGAAGLGAAGLGAAGLGAGIDEPVAAPAYMAGSRFDDEPRGGIPWWIWALLGLLALALLWWFLFRTPMGPATPGVVVPSEVASPFEEDTGLPADTASLPPAEGTVAIPEGAGVTTETRDGKPVVKVYFDTAKTEVAPAFAAAAGGLKAYLATHAEATLAVSGFNDKTGNAAANAELSKNRAKAVQGALVSAGIPEANITLAKPQDTTDTAGSDAAARRVEVVVK